jgi:hypothetical protein
MVMKIKYSIFLLLITTTVLNCMDQPPINLFSMIDKNQWLMDFSPEAVPYKVLTENKAQLLKTLVAYEHMGNHSPLLSQVELFLNELDIPSIDSVDRECINISLFYTDRKSFDFVQSIQERSSGAQDFINLVRQSKHCFDGGIIRCACEKILKDNQYVARAYGSYEPYQNRIMTPLHYVLVAVGDGSITESIGKKLCKLLLHSRANASALDGAGNVPMHYASTPQLVQLLCFNGAGVDIKGEFRYTPLINSIRLCNWRVTKCLLQYSLNLNKRDDMGNTALHKAAQVENEEIVQLLLEAGASWMILNNEVLFPFYMTKNEKIRALISECIDSDLTTIFKNNDELAMCKIIASTIPIVPLGKMAHCLALVDWIAQNCVDVHGNVCSSAAEIFLNFFGEQATHPQLYERRDQ